MGTPKDVAEDRLENPTLNQVYSILTKDTPQQAAFIPQVFYALHQLKGDPNNSGNTLETATSSIRHRIKQCKSLLSEDQHCIELFSTPASKWPQEVKRKEHEIESKRYVQKQLGERIKELLK